MSCPGRRRRKDNRVSKPFQTTYKGALGSSHIQSVEIIPTQFAITFVSLEYVISRNQHCMCNRYDRTFLASPADEAMKKGR